jgi:hypothetical protein
MKPRKNALVLSVYCNSRGFGFVIFEGSLAPFDWGICVRRGSKRGQLLLSRVESLLDRYEPDILVTQDVSRNTRSGAALAMVTDLRAATEKRGIPVYTYSRRDVEDAFEPYGANNKQEIAELIARNIPAFERYVPPPRKPWMSEDARMGLFDAAALGLVFYKAAL